MWLLDVCMVHSLDTRATRAQHTIVIIFRRFAYMKFQSSFLLVAFALFCSPAIALPDPEYLCKPSRPILLPGKPDPVGPVYLSRNSVSGDVERFDIVMNPTQERSPALQKYSARRVPVPAEQYRGLCDFGYSVAILPIPERASEKRGADHAKSGIYQQANLPGSFSIAMYYGVVFGNFWVPSTIQVSHTAHLVDFTVDQVNFVAANSGTHFAQVQTAVSNSDFASDFDGKGFMIGLDATYCGASTPVYTSAAETWTINSAATNVVVWDQTKSPNMCAAMPTSIPVRFFAGANRAQKSQYWRYDNGASSPTFQSGIVDSYEEWFRQGGAGTAFLVATFGSYPGEYWALYFTNVAS